MIDGYVYKQTAIDAICTDWCGTSNADCKNPFNPEKDEYYHCDGCGDIELIKALPSADVVEVVRCKYCKHSTEWYRDKRKCFLWCEDGIDVFEDGFCNYWERKDGEQDG